MLSFSLLPFILPFLETSRQPLPSPPPLASLYKSFAPVCAPLALPSSSYFFFLFIFHAAKANACIMRGTRLLAVTSESNDLREWPSNRSTREKGATATRSV